MKKILKVFIVLLVMVVMTACGKSESKSNGKTDINIVEKPKDDSEREDLDRDDYDDGQTGEDNLNDTGDRNEDDWEEDGEDNINDVYDEDDWDAGEVTRIEVNGHVYEYFEEDLTWTEAREACIEKGGHLVTITNQEEADLLYEFFYDKKAWIGAYKFGGTWYWVTHEDWGFTNWDNNEPSNSKGVEWCVHLWTDMRWNDLSEEDVKNKVAGYICEFDEYVDHGDY